MSQDNLFVLLIPLSDGNLRIYARESGEYSAVGSQPTHTKLLLHGRFTRARSDGYAPVGITIDTWIGVPGHVSIDGKDARLAALGAYAHALWGDSEPGFEPREREWLEAHQDELGAIYSDREEKLERMRARDKARYRRRAS